MLRQANNQIPTTTEPILLYPNPTNGKIVVSKDLAQYGGCKIDVSDLRGRIILSSMLDTNETLFEKDLSFLNAGTYLLQIYCDDSLIETLKVIIQK